MTKTVPGRLGRRLWRSQVLIEFIQILITLQLQTQLLTESSISTHTHTHTHTSIWLGNRDVLQAGA